MGFTRRILFAWLRGRRTEYHDCRFHAEGAVKDRSIHDNKVYAYSVLCERRQIVLYTEYRDGVSAGEFTDVIFSGVVAHHFQDVLSGNILFGIEEVGVADLVRDWTELFAGRKKYAWPDVMEYKDPEDLIRMLEQRGVKAFEISSSFGLGGWVLATKKEVSERAAKMEP